MLIREAFLRGLSTRQVGRVVATLTGEAVSAQTREHPAYLPPGTFYSAPYPTFTLLPLDSANLAVENAVRATSEGSGNRINTRDFPNVR